MHMMVIIEAWNIEISKFQNPPEKCKDIELIYSMYWTKKV